jgi:predicted nucleotidyltransferase
MTSESTEQVDATLKSMRAIFGNALVAVYLHGSAVNGGLKPSSDIDLMAVIDAPMTTVQRTQLMSALLRTSARHPVRTGDRRPLEVLVLLRSELAGPELPTRAEFLYGEWLRADFEAGVPAGPLSNPDIALMLAQARQTARSLAGPEAAMLLPAIGTGDVRRAMSAALPALLEDLQGDERNGLLTLARMWRTAVVGDFVAKDVAANWAIQRMPEAEAAVLADARAAYLGSSVDDLESRRGEVALTAAFLRRKLSDLL